MQLIGITGLESVGKKTAVTRLADYPRIIPYGMIDPLIQAVGQLYAMDTQWMGSQWETSSDWWNATPREMVQEMAAHFILNQGAKALVRRAELVRLGCNEDPTTKLLIVYHITTQQELDWLQKHGAQIWHIERPGIEVQGTDIHTEDQVRIINDGTLNEFHHKIDQLVRITLNEEAA